jgi:hypothetical protein
MKSPIRPTYRLKTLRTLSKRGSESNKTRKAMNRDTFRAKLVDILETLRGREVFYVYCGPSTGSVLDIHFAPVKPRPKPLSNPALSEIYRQNMGTVSLFVECSWRLQEQHKVISGSGDTFDHAAEVFLSLRRLTGLRVEQAIIPDPNDIFDLRLCFHNGLQLRVFCDSGLSTDDDYVLFYDEEALGLVSGATLRMRT